MNTPLPSLEWINDIVLTSISLYIVKHIYVTSKYQEKKMWKKEPEKIIVFK